MTPLKQLESIEGIEASKGRDERVLRENQWVRDINRGDKKAFEAVYKYYYPQLGSYVLRFTRDRSVTEDVIHNVFCSIWTHRQLLRPSGTLKAYLFTAVRNQALKHLEQEGRRSGVSFYTLRSIHSERPSPEEDMELLEFEQHLQHALTLLSERQREIFLLNRESRMSYREIAEVLDISIKTVETHMRRCLSLLQKRLVGFKR